jgi:catechol-2,3-dioxygenase
VGLRHYEILLPDQAALAQTLARVEAAGVGVQSIADGCTLIRDPSGNGVVLRTP